MKHKNTLATKKKIFHSRAPPDPCATNPEAQNLPFTKQTTTCLLLEYFIRLHKIMKVVAAPDTCKPRTTTLFNQQTNQANISYCYS